MSHNHGDGEGHGHAEQSWRPVALSGGLLVAGLASELIGGPPMLSVALFVACMILSGYSIANAGVRSLLKGSITIDLLVTVAAVGASAIGHLEEGASVVLLFNVAERLEDWAGDRARHAIEELMELRPEVAVVRRGGSEATVPVGDVSPGEVYVLRPGSRIPLDGVVVEGEGGVDQSAITGESAPAWKEPGSELYAGTLNVEGFIAARATRMAEESTLSRILTLVEEAEEARSPTEAFVDRFARWYTPTILVAAAATAALPPLLLGQPIYEWVYRALVMLVVACPCALAISTPVAMVSAITSASRYGVLVKGGVHLEALSRARVVAFDKTGTLTEGRLRVTGVVGGDEVLGCAATLESRSEHRIAEAIRAEAKRKGLKSGEPTGFRSRPGRGVEAELAGSRVCVGNLRMMEEEGLDPQPTGEGTAIYVSRDGKLLGSVHLTDAVRAEAAPTVRALKRKGFRTEMLTGDREETAKQVASETGVDAYQARLLPEEKVRAVEGLRPGVIMVGDGVNDAPALAAADVGVAMGVMGSDAALEAADVALLEDRLDRIPYLLDLAKATMRVVRQNIAASLTIKLGVAILAVLGYVSLWAAVAVGDMGLTLLVIGNSLRLSRIRPES